MRKRGKKLYEIEEAVSLSRTTVCKALKTYREGGWKALRGKQRGTKMGENRNLNPDQEASVQAKIIDRRPEQLKLDFALWTREAVRQLILHECGIDMPIRTVGEYLKRWGFTPQKPVKFAYERRPEKVKEWLDETFPEIRERAKQEKAEIYWGDETGLIVFDDMRFLGEAMMLKRLGGHLFEMSRDGLRYGADHRSNTGVSMTGIPVIQNTTPGAAAAEIMAHV